MATSVSQFERQIREALRKAQRDMRDCPSGWPSMKTTPAPTGMTVMRRDGDELPLFGPVDPPIQAGHPAYQVAGGVTDDPGYASTTPVVEILRAK